MTTAQEQYRALVAKLEAINPSEPQVQAVPSIFTPEPVQPTEVEVQPTTPGFRTYLPK